MQQHLSTASLIKASLAAVVLAALLSITVILPAEYGIDPTGLGESMGFTKLHQNGGDSQDTAGQNTSSQDDSASTEFETIEVLVPAGRGIEYKFFMQKHQSLEYSWLSEADLYFDLHGEPEGDTSGYFLSYTIAESNAVKGSFVAPFTGSHGWYWKNKTANDISVQLLVKGQYKTIGLK